ncbi:DNA2/NAM7 helicase [Theobroma cacao]|nr:DNA2/NAM7 helicase [Theobroma cacao]
MGGECSSKNRVLTKKNGDLIDIVFSWSLEDIFNDNLYKDQVEKIPVSFQSMEQYTGSYLFPLLEETRAAICSSMDIIAGAPYAEVRYLNEAGPHGTLSFDVNVDYWRNRFSDPVKEPYKTFPGDILVIADAKPETASDLQRVGRTWTFALVTNIPEDDYEDNSSSTSFKVKAVEDIASKGEMQNSLFVVFLRNVTTNRRIWNALHMKGNLKIIKEVLHTDSMVEESCSLCSSQNDGTLNEVFLTRLLSQLNESQRKAVLACLNKMQCNHKAHVELIWGPPGTGKTKTLSVLLFTLLRKKYRTLTCAPTNIAITEVAARVLQLVKAAKETLSDDPFCSLGDILLFGNKWRLKVGTDIEEIFLDHRVKRLTDCLGPLGWCHCFTAMITFLEDCVSQYHIFLENESIEERKHGSENENQEQECCSETDSKKAKHKSFLEYVREIFASTALPLRRCVSILFTHIPKIYFLEHNIQDFKTLFRLLNSFESGLFLDGVVSEEVEEIFLHSEVDKLLPQNFVDASLLLCSVRSQCLSVLKALRDSLRELKLPSATNTDSIKKFCFQTASLLFSTACGSYELYKVRMKPLNVLVIDEASRLKECESPIPLQLPGIAHSILVGDECQLPATVLSNVSSEAGFGRSLFERLSTLGHSKHLLNIQYRMHPSISCFPNASFYYNRILDAPCVVAIQEKLGVKYEKTDGFALKVKSVDGFQGGEEDIIIISTRYTQVLKAWDVLPLEDVGRLVKRLDGIFKMHTDDFISHCNEKYLKGNLEVPKTWTTSFDIVRYKTISQGERENSSSGSASDGRCYVENSKVSESLLLMKFYSLSSGVVNHLLSDRDGKELELPFEVTDQERDIILFQRSSFILGRSGTGKTTVLTMKLFKKEQLQHLATRGFKEVNTNNSNELCPANRIMDGIGGTEATVLRQLFVTASPKLCYAVKHHVLQLKSFYDARELSISNKEIGNAPISLRNFIRTREVNYEKFCSIYWPHFNAKLTKSLDSSRVFTEIISHIKGGLRSGDYSNGRLNEEDYVKLSEGRASILSRHERQMIYDSFQDYEKMKGEKGEFDMADLVIDLHRRLRNERYEGDIMDFVYIDEVQDLTIRQIALFKHVCKNVSEGFVFCGDTAQTIARGIDFRFEDIRSLYYNEFVLESKYKVDDGKKWKGQISKCFNLSQNFRTHDGVLRLAESVIDLLYRFFPSFVDILCPETSLIYGEAPILLESENEDNAIATIFRNHGNVGGHMVGFGAEQVILVRDDLAKNEILKYVGKQALVLTIVECKGLEFQDVLLYNFFSSSPLKSQWRVVYAYMKERGLVDASWLFPSFKMAKHNILCSELKQLYVAITRTRQRLWICENEEEFSKPVFNYWKKKCLVQVRKLDDSRAQAMQVASSPEEWKSLGYKLLQHGNYVMATICFERAHDTYGEKLSKAFGLRADADRLHGLNPEMSSTARRQAAEIFYSIGKAEHAADCFYMLKESNIFRKMWGICSRESCRMFSSCWMLQGCSRSVCKRQLFLKMLVCLYQRETL